MELVLLIGVFVLFTAMAWSGYLTLTRRQREFGARLQVGILEDPVDRPSPVGRVLGELTPALAAQVPASPEERNTLAQELRQAGFYRRTALVEYNAVRAVLMILPLIVAGVIAVFVDDLTQVAYIWVGALLASLLGFSAPRVYVNLLGRARSVAIERGLPTAIEMLTLCMGAGQNVLNSLARVAVELQRAFPDLAFELQIVYRQAELRSLEFALANFANRVGIPHLRNLAVILTQSEHLGTDAVGILREYADHMRVNQRQRAQELANKAPFKLLFPAYIMAIGAAIMIVGPPVLEIARTRRSNVLRNPQDLIPPQEQPSTPNLAGQPSQPAPTAPGQPQ
jgi:tight adherence protein C